MQHDALRRLTNGGPHTSEGPGTKVAMWLQNLQQPFLLPIKHTAKQSEMNKGIYDRVQGMAALEDAGFRIKTPDQAIALQEFAECCNNAPQNDVGLALAKARNYAQQDYLHKLRHHTTNLFASMAYMTSPSTKCHSSVWSNVVIVSYEITNEIWHQMLLSDGVCMVWVWLLAEKAQTFFRCAPRLRDHAIVQTYHHSSYLPLLWMGSFCCVSVEYSKVKGLHSTRSVVVVHEFKSAPSLAHFNTSAAWETARLPLELTAWMRENRPVSDSDNVKASWDVVAECWESVEGVANFAGGYANDLVAFDIRKGALVYSAIPYVAMHDKLVNQGWSDGATTPSSGESAAELRKLPEQWNININPWSKLTQDSCKELSYVESFNGLVRLDSVPKPFAELHGFLRLEVSDGKYNCGVLLAYEIVEERIASFQKKMTPDIRNQLDGMTNTKDECLDVWNMISSAEYCKVPVMCLRAASTPPPACASYVLDPARFPRSTWVSSITFAANMTLFMANPTNPSGKKAKLDHSPSDVFHFASSWGTYIFLRLCSHVMISRIEWSRLPIIEFPALSMKMMRMQNPMLSITCDALGMIAEHLDYDAWRCLGWTCKSIHQILFVPEKVRTTINTTNELQFFSVYHHQCVERLINHMLDDYTGPTASTATYDVWNGSISTELNVHEDDESFDSMDSPTYIPETEMSCRSAMHNIFTFHTLPNALLDLIISIPRWSHGSDFSNTVRSAFPERERYGYSEVDTDAQALNFDDFDDADPDEVYDIVVPSVGDDDIDIDTTVYDISNSQTSFPSFSQSDAQPSDDQREDGAVSGDRKLDPSLQSALRDLAADAQAISDKAIVNYHIAIQGTNQKNAIKSYLYVMCAWKKWAFLDDSVKLGLLCKFDLYPKLHSVLRDMRPLSIFHTRVFAEVVMTHLTRTLKNAFQWHDFEAGLHCYRDRAFYDLLRGIGQEMQLGSVCMGFNLKRFEELPAGNRTDFVYRQLSFDASHWFGDTWHHTISNIDTVGDVFRLWHFPMTPTTEADRLRRDREMDNTWHLRAQVVDVRCGHGMYAKPVRTPGEAWNFEDTRIMYYCNQEDPHGNVFADQRESVVLTLCDGDMDIIVNIGVQNVIDAIGNIQELSDLHINNGIDARRRNAEEVCKLVGAVVDISVIIPPPMIFVVDDSTPRHLRNLCWLGTEQNKVVMAFPILALDLEVLHAGWRNHDEYRIPSDVLYSEPHWGHSNCMWSSDTHGFYPQKAHTHEVVLKTGFRDKHAFHRGHLSFPHLAETDVTQSWRRNAL